MPTNSVSPAINLNDHANHNLMRITITLALTTVFLFACSTEQFYAAGRSSQRADCLKQTDTAARERCLKDANTPYDTYKKDADAARQ